MEYMVDYHIGNGELFEHTSEKRSSVMWDELGKSMLREYVC